ncbi:Rv3235 family protein [Mycobacterium sp.]|uniref:Rv3235 family protein n=1 Tax=Mycobacterium sp. TaxID=1785 RepID=UPI0031D118AD
MDRQPCAVAPIVDCEPPTRDVRQCRPSSTTLRKRNTYVPQHLLPESAISVPMRQAAGFAAATLRRVLEVIDRRRPIAQLNDLLAAGLVNSVLSANRRVGTPEGVAVLRRVRLQPVSGLAAAEVFGSYSRGQRMHAIACRIERCAGRWQVVALHIG